MGLMMAFSVIAAEADSSVDNHPMYQPYPQNLAQQYQVYQSPPQSSPNLMDNISDRAINMFLDHGITGLVLLILGWWYYQRQKKWDEESSAMRKELMEYVKADQTSDYDMMKRIDNSKQELKEQMMSMKDEILREISRR